jgi:MFS transporter, SET family, sugar efflux transporter
VVIVEAIEGTGWWMTSGPGSTSGSKLPQLLVSVLLLGIADSMIGPYLVLFGADEARLSALQVGVFMSVIAVSGLAVSTWLGRRYDRSASGRRRSSRWRHRRSATWR